MSSVVVSMMPPTCLFLLEPKILAAFHRKASASLMYPQRRFKASMASLPHHRGDASAGSIGGRDKASSSE